MFPNLWADATKTTMALMEATLENVRTSQDAVKRQADIVSRMENPWSVKWSGTPVPYPQLAFQAKDMEASREMFHLMADVNISSWENVAKAYAAAPAWSKAPFKAPGEFWSKWFDQFQTGKFDAPFSANTSSIFEKMMPGSFAPSVPANESVEKKEEFELESPDASETSAKPNLLKQANGKADDLTLIKGIGPKLQATLNELGIFHFAQIAELTPENIGWLDDKLSFKGRIHREAWVEQAQAIQKSAA